MTTDPGATLDKVDPGDDVQLRFRYQHAFAAIQCMKLIAASPEFVAVYCENHEDVLLRRTNGRYVGVQVKTRKFDGAPLMANDIAVEKSIARFAALESKYGACFDGHRLVTNHRFWHDKEDSRCLAYLIALLKKRGHVKGLPKTNVLKAYVLRICDQFGCREADVATALGKLVLSGFESDLEHTYRDLRDVVGSTADLGSQSHTTVCRIADNLVFHAYEASSRMLGGGVADLYDLVSDFDVRRDELILAGKTITAETVKKLIAEWIEDGADNLLISANLVPGELLPLGVDVLTEKLERGGLQTARVDKLKDFKASMESLYMRWRYKHSVEQANLRLAHLKTLVEDDCTEARIANENGDMAYAPAMYQDLRQRLRARAENNMLPLFGAAEEHLLGTAGILTEECRVWWSEPFELRSRRAS